MSLVHVQNICQVYIHVYVAKYTTSLNITGFMYICCWKLDVDAAFILVCIYNLDRFNCVTEKESCQRVYLYLCKAGSIPV